MMSTLHVSEKTHQGMLPQFPALESVSADTVGVTTKRGTDTASAVAGVQHGRGENLHHIRLRAGRHRVTPGSGSDPVYHRTTAQVRTVQPAVFVLDKHKTPLMPTSPRRARQLLRDGRARVAKLQPFTIRLVDRLVTDSQVDGVVVKLDPGSRFTGLAVARVDTAGATHGLFAVEIAHRGQQISKNLKARAARRRGRRSRNLRYRAPRFNNRVKPKGWLAPSLRHRVTSTTTWVTRLQNIAPVAAASMELVRFDMQKLVNPEIAGVGYQQGTLAGFEVREYLLAKWHRRCAYCYASGIGFDSVPLNIDHIHPRARGGSNRVSNLTLACIPCNQTKDARDVAEFVTDSTRLARITAHAKLPLADAAAVSSTRWALRQTLTELGMPVTTGSGGRTKWNRTQSGLPKSHTLDALCVGDIADVASAPSTVLMARSTGRGTYARTRSDKHGFPRLRLTRQKRHFGFATGDHVRAVVPTGAKAGTYVGRVAVRASGSFNVTTIRPDGNTVTVQSISHRHFRLLNRADGWGYTRKAEKRV